MSGHSSSCGILLRRARSIPGAISADMGISPPKKKLGLGGTPQARNSGVTQISNRRAPDMTIAECQAGDVLSP